MLIQRFNFITLNTVLEMPDSHPCILKAGYNFLDKTLLFHKLFCLLNCLIERFSINAKRYPANTV